MAGVVRRGPRLNGPGTRVTPLRVLAAVGAVLAVLFLAGLLPFELVRVESDSMAPTLHSGDRLLVLHGAAGVRRGDVVVLHDPRGDGDLVKRVVALGGDRVSIEDGVLVLDGVPVVEPYTDPQQIDGVFHRPRLVPPGEVFVLGDHRRDSLDSRDFGTVPVTELVGRVVWRVGPAPGSV